MTDFYQDAEPALLHYLQFDQARELVRSLGLRSAAELTAWLNGPGRPSGVPADPRNHYGEQWRGPADFCGYGYPRSTSRADALDLSSPAARVIGRQQNLRVRLSCASWKALVASKWSMERFLAASPQEFRLLRYCGPQRASELEDVQGRLRRHIGALGGRHAA